jgi:hypothetical protein
MIHTFVSQGHTHHALSLYNVGLSHIRILLLNKIVKKCYEIYNTLLNYQLAGQITIFLISVYIVKSLESHSKDSL